jgi:outer membrane protein assembly factor BamB
MGAKQIYVGIKGRVAALDYNTGAILWQTSLAGSYFVNVVEDGNRVFALSQGEAYCLDAANGTILWHNPLKGCGLGLGSLVVPGRPAPSVATAAQIAADQHQATPNTAATSNT